MITYPKALRQSTLVRNLLSMSMVQAVNVLLPVVTFPYLVRVLGFEQFGVVNYALALVGFFVVFVDFGYNLSGTRDVAVLKGDRRALSVFFSTKWTAQAMLLVVATCVFALLLVTFPKLQQNWRVYALTFGLVPATMLLPTWFFQGTEQFKVLAKLQLAGRALYAIGVFTLVRSAADAWLVALLNSGTAFSMAVLGAWLVLRRDGIQFVWPGLASSMASLRDGTGVFASSFAVTAYNYSALLILGSFGTDRLAGQYAAVEKILLVFRSGLSTLFSVIFPRTCQLATLGPAVSGAYLQRVFRWLLPALLGACVVLASLATPLMQWVVGSHEPALPVLLSFMAWIPLLVGINMASYQQLLAHRQQHSYTVVLITAAACSIACNLLLAPRYGPLGTAWSVLFAEILIALGLLYATEVRYRSLSIWRQFSLFKP